MNLPSPQTLTTFLLALGTTIAAGVADFGSPGLSVTVKAIAPLAAALVVAVYTYSIHANTRAETAAAAALGVARAHTASSTTAAPDITQTMGHVAAVMSAIQEPSASPPSPPAIP